MIRRSRGRRGASAVLAALILLGASVLPAPATASAVDKSTTAEVVDVSTAPAASRLSVRISGITPALPRTDPSTQVTTVTAVVTNNSEQPITDLYAQLRRAAPIDNESTLTDAVTDPQPVGSDSQSTTPIRVPTVAAKKSVTVRLQANSSSQAVRGVDPLCLCSTGIYPVDVAVGAIGYAGIDVEAWGQILIPNFHPDRMPLSHAVRVSWVWPLIDRPHRILDSQVFQDDQLGDSVAPGGRLYRALQVARLAPPTAGLTLLVDPELIDSLQVMATGYQVRTGSKTVAGTKGPFAAAWLQTFGAVAATHDISLTAYGDPDVDAVVRAGLAYSTTLDGDLEARITQLIGRRPDSDLAWPVDGTATARGLDAMVGGGATQIVLSDKALPSSGRPEDGTPDAITNFTALTGSARVAVTSTELQRSLTQALGASATSVIGRQALLSELAVRAAQYTAQTRYAVLAPDRYVDVDVTRAVSLINAVVGNSWSAGLSVEQAAATVAPVSRDSLVEPPAAAALPTDITATLAATLGVVDVVRDTLSSADAGRLLSGYQSAVARGESSWWRTHRGDGLAHAQRLQQRASTVRDSVRIVPGSSYALASADAPLYVTVDNTLPVPVTVVVAVVPAPGERGFHAGSVKHTVAANSRSQVSVPTRTDRSGRFRVEVGLRTTQGEVYSTPLDLRVTSSAIGGIALTITAVAFGILLLALAIRLIRRLRRRARTQSTGSAALAGPMP